ncbi:ATP12 family protein [Yoonia sp. SS1-5]|uniref:ATP12 family chaperone protein n=1 Tax=Yoonia rhodophyticola TaxID=3137370 RepID=A0AAN0NLY0_9RHOB
MSDWQPKRFWKVAEVVAGPEGHEIHLDGRPVKTPAKASLVVPTDAMARAIAQEWDAQADKVDPRTMPVTRSANAAIDKVRVQRNEVIDLLAEYGDSDLLCYRASGPEGLVLKQAAAWDPMLEWAAQTLGVHLAVGQGVMHVAQDPGAVARLRSEIAGLDEFALAAAHDLISLSGSLVLACAVMREHIAPQDAWDRSRVDEDWQISQWGADDEASAAAEVKRAAFFHAAKFYDLTS